MEELPAAGAVLEDGQSQQCQLRDKVLFSLKGPQGAISWLNQLFKVQKKKKKFPGINQDLKKASTALTCHPSCGLAGPGDPRTAWSLLRGG